MGKFINNRNAYYNTDSIEKIYVTYQGGMFDVRMKLKNNDSPVILEMYRSAMDAQQAIRYMFFVLKTNDHADIPRTDEIGRLYARAVRRNLIDAENPVIIHCTDGTVSVVEGDILVREGTIKKLVDSAFLNKDDIRFIDFRKSNINVIGTHTFNFCKNLESIYLPTSITKIGPANFTGCDKLTEIHYRGAFEQWLNIDRDLLWNIGLPKNCKLLCCQSEPISIAPITLADRERETC